MFAAGQNYYEAANAVITTLRSTVHYHEHRISQMAATGKFFEEQTNQLTLENGNLKRTADMGKGGKGKDETHKHRIVVCI